jgi:hypothetical protein
MESGETCRDKLEWQTPTLRYATIMTPLTPDVGSTPTSSTPGRAVVGYGAVRCGLLWSSRVISGPVGYGAAGYATLRCGKDMAGGCDGSSYSFFRREGSTPSPATA